MYVITNVLAQLFKPVPNNA